LTSALVLQLLGVYVIAEMCLVTKLVVAVSFLHFEILQIKRLSMIKQYDELLNK